MREIIVTCQHVSHDTLTRPMFLLAFSVCLPARCRSFLLFELQNLHDLRIAQSAGAQNPNVHHRATPLFV